MKCHNPACSKLSIYDCPKCEEANFPLLRICSNECYQICGVEHYKNWHNSSSEYCTEPVPLIEVRNQEEDQASLLLVPRGRKLLQKMCQYDEKTPTKIRVLAIMGGSRSGKSSLMNWLLNVLGVIGTFHVAPGTKPVTSGLWMWGTPILLKDGSYLILLDSEGTQRGRDAVTAAVTGLSAELASFIIINMKGGITNSVHNFSANLAECISNLTVEKRELVWRCADITTAWKQQTGDLTTYLNEQLKCVPLLSNKFNVSLETTLKPTDMDLTNTENKDTSFHLDIKVFLDKLINNVSKAIYYDGHELFDRLEKTLKKYVSNGANLLPSLITQIHKQEAETELNTYYAIFEKEASLLESLIPYFTQSYDMDRSLKFKESEISNNYKVNCGNLKLSQTIIDEYLIRINNQMATRRNIVILSFNNHITKLQKQKAEEEKIKRQSELQKQQAQAAEEASWLAVEQQRLAAEQQRMAEIQRQIIEQQRLANEQQRLANEQRLAAERHRIAMQRYHAEQEQQRIAEQQRQQANQRAEEQRRLAEQQRADAQRREVEYQRRVAEEQRRAIEFQRQQAAQYASHHRR